MQVEAVQTKFSFSELGCHHLTHPSGEVTPLLWPPLLGRRGSHIRGVALEIKYLPPVGVLNCWKAAMAVLSSTRARIHFGRTETRWVFPGARPVATRTYV